MTKERKKLAADAWGALLQVHASVVPVLDRELRNQVGLPLTWYDVLLELAAAPDRRLTMSDLSTRVVLSRTRVSRVVDELAGDGLVRREVNPDDAGSSFAILTDAGLDRFRRAAPVYVTGIEREFAHALSDSQLAGLARTLGTVRKSLPLGRQL